MSVGEDGERSGDLHPGGSATDDGERQPLIPRLPVARSLRLLERAVDAVAQVKGVAERLQAARDVLPFVVAEVGRAGAAGDDQAVVVETLAAVEDHLPPLGVHVGGLRHHDRRVGAAPERRPQRRGALARRDGARRELVEQGLEEVVVRPIDQRHLDVGAPQLLGGGQATEPAADDDDAATPTAVALSRHGRALSDHAATRRARTGAPVYSTSSAMAIANPKAWAIELPALATRAPPTTGAMAISTP